MRLKKLRNIAIFPPSSFISKGRVTQLTMVEVVINTAATIMPAPFSISDATSGKEINAGRCNIVPIIPAKIIPLKPELSPKYWVIVSDDKKPCIIPINKIMTRINGIISTKDITAILTPCKLFSFDLKKDTSKIINTKIFIATIARLMSILNPQNNHVFEAFYSSYFIGFDKQAIIFF